MKLWKRWTAAVLAAAMMLVLLAACGGPSGPTTPDQPEKPSTSEPGKDPATEPGTGDTGDTGSTTIKDPNNEKTEEAKVNATVEALNAVRKENGLETPLVLDAQACAIAKEMAQVQMDGVNGKYGESPSTNTDYIDACAKARNQKVGEKSSIGFGALLGAYPDAGQFRKWAAKTTGVSAERNNALVKSKDATLVGIGVVPNPDTTSQYKYMVVVMTY